MNAMVTLNEVLVTQINHGHMGKTVYSGKVILQARSEGLDFNFAFPFNSYDSVAGAVAQAAKMLKSELNALAAATQVVLEPQ